VEGSISTSDEVDRIRRVRRQAGTLVAIGTCATAGGVQALRNFADAEAWAADIYPRPQVLDALATSTPLSEHVQVDIDLWGCPIDGEQVLEVIAAVLQSRRPRLPRTAVCATCKRSGAACVLVAEGIPCLGPLTRDGCGALCPNAGRGCYGCFGPLPDAQVESMAAILRRLERRPGEGARLLRHISAYAPEFRRAAALLSQEEAPA
jgi:sulfhydrogenase subunit delta